ncbi:hypothetical protein CHGG_01213 [Chaetomium globosum CBS 148.51]|uniref:Uncharacterized protein n=1 Tax=Chaetomium globosum (strain ATCC 6205 / CBS 148.51 / DSM 1962 / NBRC 6347 / NRRL 1970) TaxID=306901 RepID=Q2HEZ1_CHAGB|nr:uncharacterized protein CHGG_01213 [Chaetomium globosum CBS 148.51]EAQ92978.1 hypothetical protein CHGG_01213 [Chaetomium globosum CBS 148.51]
MSRTRPTTESAGMGICLLLGVRPSIRSSGSITWRHLPPVFMALHPVPYATFNAPDGESQTRDTPLGGSFRILIFLANTPPPPSPPMIAVAASKLRWPVLGRAGGRAAHNSSSGDGGGEATRCGRCRTHAARALMVSGTVPLTAALLGRGVGGDGDGGGSGVVGWRRRGWCRI